VDSLGLIEDGFQGDAVLPALFSDQVLQQDGDYATYNSGTMTWGGALAAVVPGKAYWIVNKHPSPAAGWDYTYEGVPALPLVATDHEGVITRTDTNSSKQDNSASRTTSVKKSAKTKKVSNNSKSK
jgi:hypothetical protein